MTIKFYNYTAEQERVDKTSYLGTATTTTADQVEGLQNVLAPSFIVSSNTVPDYNYAYVQEFARYYFVDAPIWIANNTWRVNMRIDVLFTYKTAITSQNGVVQYSTSGSPLLYDPRLVYNQPPTFSTAAPASTIKKTYAPMILMRVHYFDDNGLHTHNVTTPDNNTRYYIMNVTAFNNFAAQLTGLSLVSSTEDLAVEIGKSIMDFTLLFYFTASSITDITPTDHIHFNTPAINMVQGGGTGGGYDMNLNNQYADVYMLEYDDILKPVTVSWMLAISNYWQRKAKRSAYIPFIGSLGLDVDLLGKGNEMSYYAGVQIGYDFASNSYVLTPGVSALTDPTPYDTLKTLYPTSAQHVANMFTFPFTADASYENVAATQQQQAIAIVGQVVGGIVAAIATEGASLPTTAISLGMGVSNMNLSDQRMQYQQATSLVTRGSSNGGSPDMVYAAWAAGSISYPSVHLETVISPPAPGYASYQSAYGYPDGQYRALSTLTGYVQLAEIILTGVSAISSTECDQIRRLLLSGVIM